jgi:hypothetical protein
MTFEIRNDIPVPKRVGGRAGKSKYPFVQMAPGQSFLVPSDIKPAAVRSAAQIFSKNNPEYKFAIRIVSEGMRVWCVKSPNQVVAAITPTPDPTEDEAPDFEENEDAEEVVVEETE